MLLSSCTKEVVLELADQEGTNIVVDGLVNDDGSQQFIRLSLTSSYYENNNGAPASGATVEVFGNNTTYTFTESTNPDSAGYYLNNSISSQLVEGNYTLTVIYDGQTYTANETYELAPVLDSLSFILNPFTEFANTNLEPGEDSTFIYDVTCYFENPPGERYFYFDRFINGEIRTPRPADKSISDNEDLTDYVALAPYTYSIDKGEPGDTVGVTINSVSEEYYNFLIIYFDQTDLSGNPFAGAPPANIPSNISGDGLGFFEVVSTSYAEKVFQ